MAGDARRRSTFARGHHQTHSAERVKDEFAGASARRWRSSAGALRGSVLGLLGLHLCHQLASSAATPARVGRASARRCHRFAAVLPRCRASWTTAGWTTPKWCGSARGSSIASARLGIASSRRARRCARRDRMSRRCDHRRAPQRALDRAALRDERRRMLLAAGDGTRDGAATEMSIRAAIGASPPGSATTTLTSRRMAGGELRRSWAAELSEAWSWRVSSRARRATRSRLVAGRRLSAREEIELRQGDGPPTPPPPVPFLQSPPPPAPRPPQAAETLSLGVRQKPESRRATTPSLALRQQLDESTATRRGKVEGASRRCHARLLESRCTTHRDAQHFSASPDGGPRSATFPSSAEPAAGDAPATVVRAHERLLVERASVRGRVWARGPSEARTAVGIAKAQAKLGNRATAKARIEAAEAETAARRGTATHFQKSKTTGRRRRRWRSRRCARSALRGRWARRRS